MRVSALLFCLLIHAMVFSQEQRSYKELKEYEGIYQYTNNSTLKIAASPKDTLLYTLINKSKYPLTPSSKDIFLNSSGDKVVFLRDKKRTITGYAVGNDTFNLINKNVIYPETMWYARKLPAGTKFKYSYTIPTKQDDGIATGSIEKTDLDKALLATMVNKIVSGDYNNVHSVLLIQHGKLVFEEYFYEYNKDSLHELRSATKSIVSALTGIAINKGYIKSENKPVLPFFPEYTIANNTSLKSKITIANMLANQSGLDCDVSNNKSAGNETAMNYSEDWVKFTLDLSMSDVPGGKGMYCSGNPIVVSRIIEKTTQKPLAEFAAENLFTPLGITGFKWNFKPDQSNAEDFGQVYLKPRDMAKFGLMYLNGGRWNGRQVVPEKWVKASFAKHSTVQNVDYGYLWWLKYLNADGVRYNGVAAQGNGGKRIFIFPQQDLVVVLTGGNYNTQSPADELISNYILPAFNKKK